MEAGLADVAVVGRQKLIFACVQSTKMEAKRPGHTANKSSKADWLAGVEIPRIKSIKLAAYILKANLGLNNDFRTQRS